MLVLIYANKPRISSISQSRSVTPAFIAGVILKV